ncbi:hypothetical protein [Pseudomonas phage D6]|nr:hypothetical protein [Pseudomonas phage D6]
MKQKLLAFTYAYRAPIGLASVGLLYIAFVLHTKMT